MTVLPFLDVKATPIYSVDLPQTSRAQSLPRLFDADHSTKQPTIKSVRNSQQIKRPRTPKIKILPRTDEILKRLPCEKPDAAARHSVVWKPLTRELPDYDYLWDNVQREDIRHQYDEYVAPSRLIPNLPDPPKKMTSSFETQDRHFLNYKRARAMQQRQWNKEHIQYTIYPYSHLTEREMYNKYIRSTLKDQMKDKAEMDKMEQDMKNHECQNVIQRDRQDLEQDKQKQTQRTRFLFQVTTKNKELMENKWAYDQWNRVHQWHVERAMLADDPINWSKTMS